MATRETKRDLAEVDYLEIALDDLSHQGFLSKTDAQRIRIAVCRELARADFLRVRLSIQEILKSASSVAKQDPETAKRFISHVLQMLEERDRDFSVSYP